MQDVKCTFLREVNDEMAVYWTGTRVDVSYFLVACIQDFNI
jgi:hypothetical protein